MHFAVAARPRISELTVATYEHRDQLGGIDRAKSPHREAQRCMGSHPSTRQPSGCISDEKSVVGGLAERI